MSAPFQESILRLLTNRGAMTARQVAEETKGTLFGTVDSLCKLRKKHLVFQPRKSVWAAVDVAEYIEWRRSKPFVYGFWQP